MIKQTNLKGLIFPALVLSSFSANPQSLINEVHTSLAANNSNRFSSDLYSHITKEPGNTIFSPYSIYSALSMPYAGARNLTEKEMSNVLHITQSQEQFHNASAQLQKILLDKQKQASYELSIANKIFIQKDFPVLPTFVSTMNNNYGAAFDTVDFANQEQTADLINHWVSQKTGDKIETIILPQYLSPATLMVLVNAIYFSSKWEKPFEPLFTQQSPFYHDEQNYNDVDTMVQTETFKYMENDTLQILELPYKNSTISMVILLPKQIDGLTQLEKIVTQAKLNSWMAKLQEKTVTVKLPKFKLESSYMLESTLANMGMTSAFGCADFSGIDGSKSLFISKVVHKTVIEVEEAGTEAAASTAIIMARSLAPFCKFPSETIFSADHPFIFLIKDKHTNLTLFMGRVTNL